LSSLGCDSTVILNLTISPAINSYDSISACSFYTWNGNTYVESGTYTAQFTTANGCDSIATLYLTISNIEATVSLIGPNVLEAFPTGMHYQWINCTTGEYITSATNQIVTVMDGEYAVIVSGDQCSDQSDCITVNTGGLEEQTMSIKLYPNPTSDNVKLELSVGYVGKHYDIIDFSGRMIFHGEINSNQQAIDLSDLARGAYYFKIENSVFIQKLIKQ
jgi:hypothetical protein